MTKARLINSAGRNMTKLWFPRGFDINAAHYSRVFCSFGLNVEFWMVCLLEDDGIVSVKIVSLL